MIAAVIDAASWLFLVAGGILCVIGSLGLNRMPDFFTRTHAASVVDTGGAGLILLGLALQAGFTLIIAKLAMIAVLILFTSPTATHALARAAIIRGIQPALTEEGEVSSKP